MDGGKVSATVARFAASYGQGAAERMMKPRLLIGLLSVALFAMPYVASAQRGGSGGFAASGAHFASAPASAASHAASVVRTSSSVPSAVPASSSAVRARASVHSTDVPARHAGFSSTRRTQNAGDHVFSPIGPPPSRRHNPPPGTTSVATPRVTYILGVGGYYYAAPGDESAAPPQDAAQDSAEVEGQQADDQQTGAANDRNGERTDERNGGRDGDRADNGNDGQTEAGAAPRAAEQHEVEQHEAEQQEPLPDVGTLALVLRDGSRLDVVAFTMTQGQVIYITPEGRRLSISAELFDADATQRLNQERGTPMQLPL
jgi:hypothetical protein